MNSAQPISQSNSPQANTTPDKSQTAIAHGPAAKDPAPNANSTAGRWSASGDPIDTKELDAAVMTAEKAHTAKPDDAKAKKALADAYHARAMALTEARQYASALGDYRRAVKLDPSNADAKEWIDKITMIYDSLKRQAPKEGEEPPPLPFTKKA